MKKFNLRVYGILINENQEVLLSVELRNGIRMLKFPGGGLEFNEGLSDCLKREWKEEIDIDIEVDELFYVNDFLQISAFNPTDQVVSFYYKVRNANNHSIQTVSKNFIQITEGESQYWAKLSDLDANDMTFPIDKLVVLGLQKEI